MNDKIKTIIVTLIMSTIGVVTLFYIYDLSLEKQASKSSQEVCKNNGMVTYSIFNGDRKFIVSCSSSDGLKEFIINY